LGNRLVGESLQLIQAAISQAAPGMQFAIIIDGKALSYALSPLLAPKFLQVCAQLIDLADKRGLM
jgi:hypothetical protein